MVIRPGARRSSPGERLATASRGRCGSAVDQITCRNSAHARSAASCARPQGRNAVATVSGTLRRRGAGLDHLVENPDEEIHVERTASSAENSTSSVYSSASLTAFTPPRPPGPGCSNFFFHVDGMVADEGVAAPRLGWLDRAPARGIRARWRAGTNSGRTWIVGYGAESLRHPPGWPAKPGLVRRRRAFPTGAQCAASRPWSSTRGALLAVAQGGVENATNGPFHGWLHGGSVAMSMSESTRADAL